MLNQAIEAMRGRRAARLLAVLSVAFASSVLAPDVAAQSTYPAKPIRLVVPFTPGGGADLVARVVGQQLAIQLGQPIIVDNRPGAGGNIGAEIVAKAPADGYTLLLATLPFASNPGLYKRPPFDPQRDFAAISLIANAPTILVANPSLPVKSVREFIEYAKRNPGKVNYASFGNGSTAHLSGELLASVSGIDMVHVPYKGGGPAVTATLGGETQVLFSSMVLVLGHIKNGKLRPLGIAGKRRSPSLPDVPTFAESGVQYEVGSWWGLVAPARTATPIIERLHKEIVVTLGNLEVKRKLEGEGGDPVGSSPAEFSAFIKAEAARWASVIRTAKIQPE